MLRKLAGKTFRFCFPHPHTSIYDNDSEVPLQRNVLGESLGAFERRYHIFQERFKCYASVSGFRSVLRLHN